MIDCNFISINVANLHPALSPGLNLYLPEDKGQRLVLYKGKDYPLHQEDLQRLQERGIKWLFIQPEDRQQYQAYLRTLLEANFNGSHGSIQARLGVLNDVVRQTLCDAFEQRDSDVVVPRAAELGAQITDTVCLDEFAMTDLLRILHHDYATFTHSTNAAFYAAALAEKMGYPRHEIEQIVAGALLHDLGKLELDSKILAKPARLDQVELRQVRRHPTLGFRRLARRNDLTYGQLMMVYQHHERLDGSGYPVGSVASEIHPWAKLCAVIDVFEAMTSHRPYRKAMTTQRAVELMCRDSGTALDPELLECWLKIIRAASLP